MSNNIVPLPAPHRPAKNALEEFFPERALGFDHEEVQLDPQEIELDALDIPGESAEPLRLTPALDTAPVEWWPMFAAALIGIGVSLLAFGAWTRFGQF